jgi:hypothetical protein
MNTTTIPARIEASVMKVRGRTGNVHIECDEPEKPGKLNVSQKNDEVILAARTANSKGASYVTLTREQAETLCRDLAQRLNLRAV